MSYNIFMIKKKSKKGYVDYEKDEYVVPNLEFETSEGITHWMANITSNLYDVHCEFLLHVKTV